MTNPLRTHAGQGAASVYLAVLLLAHPPALSWLLASVLLTVAGVRFRQCFQRLDRIERTPRTDDDEELLDGSPGSHRRLPDVNRPPNGRTPRKPNVGI